MSSTVATVKIADRLQEMFDRESRMAEEAVTEMTRKERETMGLQVIGNLIGDSEVYRVWKAEGRQCLSVHPGLAEEVTLASSDMLYPDVFRAIPYMSPMFVFPEGNTFPSFRDNERARLIGVLCFAMRSGNLRTKDARELRDRYRTTMRTTSDADADTLGMLAVVEITDPAGRSLDLEIDRFTLHLDRRRTLAETVTDVLERFQWENRMEEGKEGKYQKYLRRVVAQSVGSLLYTCSITLDSELIPQTAVRRVSSRPQSKRHPINLYRVGWTVGAALERYRRRKNSLHSDSPSEQIDIGHQQDPQHRKAHFKRVWTGPGSTIPRMAFVAAYWTHREALGTEGVNTVRAVR
jgi:hypothetical protein